MNAMSSLCVWQPHGREHQQKPVRTMGIRLITPKTLIGLSFPTQEPVNNTSQSRTLGTGDDVVVSSGSRMKNTEDT